MIEDDVIRKLCEIINKHEGLYNFIKQDTINNYYKFFIYDNKIVIGVNKKNEISIENMESQINMIVGKVASGILDVLKKYE